MFEPLSIPVLIAIAVVALFAAYIARSGRVARRRKPSPLSSAVVGNVGHPEILGGAREGAVFDAGAASCPDRIMPESVDNASFRAASARAIDANSGLGKRLFDIACATILLLLVAPLLVVTMIAIRLDSRGPILYQQTRVGAGGQHFQIWKFRSMRIDAEENGPRWAAKNDSRITRVGRFIRKTRIDEIPQAINVLRGEMSFVGPRPERPEFVEILRGEVPNYDLRHLIKPGITGWAQVKFDYGASIEDARNKLTFDLYYIRHYSFILDIAIVLMTIRVALFGLGSR